MGTLVFGLRAALLGLFECFEWPRPLSVYRPSPHCYWGQLGPAGNSELMDLSEEPEGPTKIILYSEGQRPRLFSSGLAIWASVPRKTFLLMEGNLALRKPITQK